MLTQEAMDALIEAGLPGPEVVEADAADGEDDNPLDEEDQAPATDSDGADDTVQEDDVTQEDIDALLQQSDEQDELLDEDEDILISQDDINTLLMAADQEDEDVLGDIDGEDDTSDLEDELDDLVSDSDQVVLEGIEGAEISDGKESSKRGSSKSEKIKALLKSKIVLAAASVLLFMGISIPLSYFLFFSSEPAAPLPEKQTASLTEIDLIRDGQTDGSGNMPALPPSRRSGTVLLTDFIILASDQSRTMTYVYADVSIDYSDQRAYDEINSNLAFYRDVIYGAIQTRLVSEKNNEVTEADLLWGVEASLKKVLPPQYIDKISFKSFKAT
jgi:pilus assembly protein FimV